MLLFFFFIMKWYNALVDQSPKHHQQVLVSVDGIYYMAVYDEEKNYFVSDDEDQNILNSKSGVIYWTHLMVPGKGDN
jgi:hypothetical protein